MTVRVDVGEVQGNVLHGYGAEYDHALYLRLRIRDPDGVRLILARWVARALISFGNCRERKDPAHVNIAFTYEALSKLRLPRDLLDAFPEDYRQGARKRAWEKVRDTWAAHDAAGLPADRYHDCDVLVSITGQNERDCTRVAATLETDDDVFVEIARRRASQVVEAGHVRERFGFADGRSQPAVEGVDLDPVGDGVFAGSQPLTGRVRRKLRLMAEDFGLQPKTRSWRLIRPGEFVLGYENEDGELPSGPPAPLGPNGTFMVYREIDQYPRVFDDYVERAAQRSGMDEDELAAKIVGRWKDGTPVARIQEEEDVAANRRRANDFRYEDDPYGFGCPLGAHVRRANPRDALPGGGERTMRHRIIRRGMPYGPHTNREDKQAGLAFICFGASLTSGFEFIQREWLNTGEAFGLGDEPDFLLQQPDVDAKKPTGRTVIQGYRPVVLEPPEEPFVWVRGCEYLFVPSRSALTWMSEFTPA
jgi:Dyp-type peroxidase family